MFMSFLLAPKRASAFLVLQYIYIGPISEEETGAIQRHSMYPGWNNGCHRLVIKREPPNILHSYLLRLVIQLDSSITRRFFSLCDHLIKHWVIPVTVVIGSRGKQIQGQPIIGIREIGAPLGKTKLYLVIGRFSIISSQVYCAQIHTHAQGILPHLL